jgi:hypothetical protein
VVTPYRTRPRGIGTVSTIPVTGRIIAVGVTVSVMYPTRGAAISTVGDRPGEIHLEREGGRREDGGEIERGRLNIFLRFPDLLTSLMCVEVLWPHLLSKHDIIIQVYEVIG